MYYNTCIIHTHTVVTEHLKYLHFYLCSAHLVAVPLPLLTAQRHSCTPEVYQLILATVWSWTTLPCLGFQGEEGSETSHSQQWGSDVDCFQQCLGLSLYWFPVKQAVCW